MLKGDQKKNIKTKSRQVNLKNIKRIATRWVGGGGNGGEYENREIKRKTNEKNARVEIL